MTAASVDDAAVEKVREKEDALRDLAGSDLPAAPWARRLLALLDDVGVDAADGGDSAN